MGDANIPQQGQESVSRTFYVLRNTTWGRGEFTKTLKSGGPSSRPDHTVNDATPYYTLADAVSAQKTATEFAPTSHYEIVMVSRSVTKGVLKSPAKTVRRIVQDGEVVPFGAKWAVKNPFSDMADLTPSMWSGRSNAPVGAYLGGVGSNSPALFGSLDELLLAAIEHGTSFPSVKSVGKNARWIVRVVEETVPEVRTEDVVKDILTPLP